MCRPLVQIALNPYVQKAKRVTDEKFLNLEVLSRILQACITKMALPPELFSKDTYSDEDEPQEDYLKFRDELGKSLFLNLVSIRGEFHLIVVDSLIQLFSRVA